MSYISLSLSLRIIPQRRHHSDDVTAALPPPPSARRAIERLRRRQPRADVGHEQLRDERPARKRDECERASGRASRDGEVATERWHDDDDQTRNETNRNDDAKERSRTDEQKKGRNETKRNETEKQRDRRIRAASGERGEKEGSRVCASRLVRGGEEWRFSQNPTTRSLERRCSRRRPRRPVGPCLFVSLPLRRSLACRFCLSSLVSASVSIFLSVCLCLSLSLPVSAGLCRSLTVSDGI